MANATVHGNLSSTTAMLYQTSRASQGMATVCSALNIFFSITATLGNILSLIVLHKVSSIHPPTKLLFRCLAFTDLCVGLIRQPLYAILLLEVSALARPIKWRIFHFVDKVNITSSLILCGVSVLTSTAISVDRLLALLLGLRYRYTTTLKRVRTVIGCLWLVGISIGFVHSFWARGIAFIMVIVIGGVCLFISIFSYTKIFSKFRHHHAQVQEHTHQEQPNGGGIPLNIARYKRTVSSIAWVQLALVICYAPLIILLIMEEATGVGYSRKTFIFWPPLITVLYLNSSLNPVLYCWKITEVRQAAKNIVKRLCCLTD